MRSGVSHSLKQYLPIKKYTGDNALQRTLYGKYIKNIDYALSRVKRYLARNNHPGIISREV